MVEKWRCLASAVRIHDIIDLIEIDLVNVGYLWSRYNRACLLLE
jgi:hypothetical protein